MKEGMQQAQETGADFMMQGLITSITDAVEGKKVIKYQVSMEPAIQAPAPGSETNILIIILIVGLSGHSV